MSIPTISISLLRSIFRPEPSYASGLINGLMASPSWKDSALIFTYDEAGGFYDHVSPQPMPSPDGIQPIDLKPSDICDAPGQIGTGTCDFTYTGYRVPMIVISPFRQEELRFAHGLRLHGDPEAD